VAGERLARGRILIASTVVRMAAAATTASAVVAFIAVAAFVPAPSLREHASTLARRAAESVEPAGSGGR
jgi:hypothetical protein